MPGKVKVRVLAGRNLPVMDKSSDTSDAFVEVKLGNTTYKTEVFRHSLNPYWNSEWFRFEADDEELQDEPLQIRIMDYDTYSANDAIGKVYIDLNPLLHKDSMHIMFGWFPIYDTMHGIRGEVHLAVKVDLFSDSNRYRQSSCGVRFFYSPGIPTGYTCQAILGFVEELVVNDDPEYQWIDKIRTPRASNEARQTLFSKLSGEVKRKIGLKALDLGGNSVIGYRQCFDLEGESGIVVRGIGTAVTLVKSESSSSRRHHNYGSTPTGTGIQGSKLDDKNYDNCLSSFSDGNYADFTSHYSSIYWPSNRILSPSCSPPSIPHVAFLSSCDINFSYAFTYSRNSTPSPTPTVRSSPIPFASSAPKLGQWLNKLAKNTSPLIAKKNVANHSTLPRTRSLKIGVSVDAETAMVSKSGSNRLKEQVFLCKSALKRVASQPVSTLSRHNSFNMQHKSSSNPLFKPLSNNDSATSSTITSHPLSIVRFPIQTTNSNEDQTSNFTIPTASKGNLSSSPPESVTTPLTAPAGVYLTSPIGAPSIGPKMLTTSPKSTGMHRRGSSDPDLSTTPNCGSNHSSGSGSAGNKSAFKFMISPEGIHLLEYPFITMKQFPVGLIQHIGGVVCSRSVKLLDQINNPDDPETRDTWWMELRKEIRSHCRSLGCNAVLGYSENTNICDEVVILSAIGTAVTLTTEKEKREVDQNTPPSKSTVKTEQSMKKDCNTCDSHYAPVNCTLCHIPYTESTMPFPSSLTKCGVCKKGKVPDILFMTIEPPAEMPITGIGCLIQARVCRYKRDSKGEQCAKEISDSLPFLEYEIHRQLLSKLKVKGMNGLFGLTMQISVGDNLLIALATGTGAYISAMPPPHPPQVSSGKGVQTSKLNEIQKLIFESVSKNREHYGLIHSSVQPSNDQTYEKTLYSSCNKDMNSNDSINQTKLNLIEDEESSELDKSEEMINKGQVLLEVDDTEDADIISLMIDSDIPEGYEVCNTEIMPGLRHLYVCNLQTFAQVYRAKLNTSKQFGHQFDWILQSLFVKLRRLVPCCLTDLKFTVDLPETDLVQLTVMGSVVGLGSLPHGLTTGKGGVTLPSQVGSTFRKRTLSSSDQSDDLVFSMDEDPKFESVVTELNSKEIFYHNPPTEHSGIELTPLSFVPDGHIHYYLGNLDFFFIRESTSIRESGGLNGFMHSFLSEVFAIVRAHVAALGGNAMTALHLTQCVLLYNPHKNQSQCLINIAGDAVMVHYHNSKQNMAINKIHSEINANEGIINEEAENLSHL